MIVTFRAARSYYFLVVSTVSDEFKDKEILDRRRLVIGKRLGAGQFGVVYKGILKGEHSSDRNRIVAIKNPNGKNNN